MDGVLKALDWARRNAARHEVVNLGESRTITLAEMIDVIAGEMEKTPRVERLPMQPGDVNRTFADVSKAKELLGYDPRMDFQEGVRLFVEWLDAESSREGALNARVPSTHS
jgi:UDP-glucuronate 4-epimerase